MLRSSGAHDDAGAVSPPSSPCATTMSRVSSVQSCDTIVYDDDGRRCGAHAASRATEHASSFQMKASRAQPPLERAARDLLRAGRFQDAMAALERATHVIDAMRDGAERARCANARVMALRGECFEGLGMRGDAETMFSRAVREDDANADAWCGLARLAHGEGRFYDAMERYRAGVRGYECAGEYERARDARRALAAAWTEVGAARKARGDIEGAIRTYGEIIDEISDQDAFAASATFYNLGVALVEVGRLDEAESAYERAIASDPTLALAYCNLGVVYKMKNRLDDAVEAYEKCLRYAPDFELCLKNLSLVLTDQGTAIKSQNLPGAIATYERALSYDTLNVEAYYNLGVALAEAEEFDRALIAYENAGRLRPQCAEIWNNAGVLYKERGNDARAMEYYHRAIACNPNFAQPLNNLGVLYTMAGQAQLALEALQRAVTVAPTYAVAHNNLGVLLRDTGDIEHAFTSYRDCVRHSPNDRHAEQNYLLALNYVRSGEDTEVCEAHSAWGNRFAKLAGPPLKPRHAIKSDSGAGTPGRRRLVVGYVSPDMYTHSVSYFAHAPLRSHDKSSVKCIVYNVSKFNDAQTKRLQKSTLESGGEWRDCATLNERELAECIRGDSVDILIELTGHTANNRLETLALEPAPVQITWIGYPNSTGVRSIGYRITDELCDPLNTTQTFTEQLIRMPAPYSFLCYTPNPEAPERVAEAPCLSQGHVTFGCFNTLAKVTADVRACWARVLLATPMSRLIFKSKAFACEVIRNRFLCQMAQLGVESWRIDCLPLESATMSHLAMYDRVDIALDTFPYGGTTTTCEAVHMGVPVVTLSGSCHAQNVGKSLMTTIGLKECVASDENEYVRIASTLASDVQRISEIRTTLRRDMLRSPLCDAEGFTRALEDIYRNLWQRWCDDKAREDYESDDDDNEEEDLDNAVENSKGNDDDCCSADENTRSGSPSNRSKDDSNNDTDEVWNQTESAESGDVTSKLIDTLEI